MANTYTSFHYHFTFSTKNREPWITPEIEKRVWADMECVELLKKYGVDYDELYLWT